VSRVSSGEEAKGEGTAVVICGEGLEEECPVRLVREPDGTVAPASTIAAGEGSEGRWCESGR